MPAPADARPRDLYQCGEYSLQTRSIDSRNGSSIQDQFAARCLGNNFCVHCSSSADTKVGRETHHCH